MLEKLFYSLQPIFLKTPKRIQIGITDKCNLFCEMCPRTKFVSGKNEMSIELFKKLLEKINGTKEIILTGWGEPLLHPNLFEMIELCKKKGFKTRITTNGTLLNEQIEKKLIDSKIDSIAFSIDSIQAENQEGHQNSGVFEKIKNLKKLRKNKMPQIIIQSTLHSEKEKELIELIGKGKALGVDLLKISRLDTRQNNALKRPTIDEEKKLIKNAREFGKKNGLKVEMTNYPKINGLKNFEIFFALNFFSEKKFCIKTLDCLYIRPDGKAAPCCSLPNHIVGNLLHESLEKIWLGEKMLEFRNGQSKICAGCDALKKNYWTD